MARSTMATLITQVRELIADTDVSPTWTDDQLQDFLDRRRMEIRHVQLRVEPTYNGNVVEYNDFYSQYSYWEEDEILQDASGDTLTSLTSDRTVGYWTFDNQLPPVYITGKVFDIYGAAADVLYAWASKMSLHFDFTADGSSFKRSQKRTALLEMAQQYDAKSYASTAVMSRGDIY